MPIDPRPILIDSNILVFASIPSSAFHAGALVVLDRLDEENAPAWISTQVVREYLVHMTRPDVLGSRTLADLLEQIEKLAAHFTVAGDTPEVSRTLRGLIGQYGVHGKQVHDTNVVATCLSYGIPRLLTHNVADFQRFASEIEIETL